MRKVAIIVAGGSGSRMNASIPKQFLIIANEPLLFHTLRKFSEVCDETIIVMHPEWVSYWHELIIENNLSVAHRIVAGGETRAQSVLNGLNTIDDNTLVAIHDAARPAVSQHLIEETFLNAEKHGACIPVIALKESIRMIASDGSSNSVNRDNYRIVQTPQTFKTAVLKRAFSETDYLNYTDDASLVEAIGQSVFLIEGEINNIKVTTPSDLKLMEQYI